MSFTTPNGAMIGGLMLGEMIRLEGLVKERLGYYDQITQYRKYTQGAEAGVYAKLTQNQIDLLGYNPRYSLNICPIVLNAKCQRLDVLGFDVMIPDQDNEELETTLTETLNGWLETDEIKLLAGDIHYSASRDGDSYAIVEWDELEQRPRMSLELAYAGQYGTMVVYQDGQAVYAFRRWRVLMGSETLERMNVYYPDKVERYYNTFDRASSANTFEAGWLPYTGDGFEAVIPHVDNQGNPLGLPVFHFSNRPQGSDYGTSDLSQIVPSQQDTLNMKGADEFIANQLSGTPVNYVFGAKTPRGEKLDISAGALLVMDTGANPVTVGQLGATDLSQLIESKASTLRDIALITGTPLPTLYTGSQVQAEGTLQQQEAPLLAKVEIAQRDFESTWESLCEYMLKLDSVFNFASQATGTERVAVRWANPETRNELNDAQTLRLHKDLGVPEEMIWRKLGYSDAEIVEMKDMKTEQANTQAILGLGALALSRSATNGQSTTATQTPA